MENVVQRPKKELYIKILESAKFEFFKNGFKNSEMRIIAKKSGVALGHIYNYFKNKNCLLEVVLELVLKCLDQIFEEYNRKERIIIGLLRLTDFDKCILKAGIN